MGIHFNVDTYSYTHTHSNPHSYSNTIPHSISYSRAQSDSEASSHATSSPNDAALNATRKTPCIRNLIGIRLLLGNQKGF